MLYKIKVYYKGEKWVWDEDGGLDERPEKAKQFTLKQAMTMIYKKNREAKQNKKRYSPWELV